MCTCRCKIEIPASINTDLALNASSVQIPEVINKISVPEFNTLISPNLSGVSNSLGTEPLNILQYTGP